MFTIALLLNVNLTILRSARNTLAVVDLDIGARAIPLFEFFGVLPASILMTLILAKLLQKISIQRVFFWTISFFLIFFIGFSLTHPYLTELRAVGAVDSTSLYLIYMLFYIGCELWKPALINILFMGLVNQNMTGDDARRLYAPLMLGGSIGAILAGPIISFCTSDLTYASFSNTIHSAGGQWSFALYLLMTAIGVIGLITLVLYKQLWKYFGVQSTGDMNRINRHEKFSFSGFNSYFQNRDLQLLSWIVIADYIAYSLGEVIFLEALKMSYPDPCDYCNYMGMISSWSGILTIVSALFVTPYILQNCRWVVAASVTPICLLVTEGAFFLFLRAEEMSNFLFGWSQAEWIHVVIILGTLQYCICRTAKYTLFDSSKELAYVLIPEKDRMGGKLIIDGVCARIGRGGASALNLGLIALCGGVLASSLLSGTIAIAMGWSWLATTRKLGTQLEPADYNGNEPVVNKA
jgi:AAA family ATP:ADP antiporter